MTPLLLSWHHFMLFIFMKIQLLPLHTDTRTINLRKYKKLGKQKILLFFAPLFSNYLKKTDRGCPWTSTNAKENRAPPQKHDGFIQTSSCILSINSKTRREALVGLKPVQKMESAKQNNGVAKATCHKGERLFTAARTGYWFDWNLASCRVGLHYQC